MNERKADGRANCRDYLAKWKKKLTKENMAVVALLGLLLMVIAIPADRFSGVTDRRIRGEIPGKERSRRRRAWRRGKRPMGEMPHPEGRDTPNGWRRSCRNSFPPWKEWEK